MAIKVGSYKYFIGYIHKGNALPSPLCIKLPQMNAYAKYFDKNNTCMNLLVHDRELLQKYNEMWDKIKNLFQKNIDSELVYNDKYIKTKINLYNTNIYGNKTPIESECGTCFSVILLDSIVNVDKKYHPQIFLKECKYAMKKKKIMNTIN